MAGYEIGTLVIHPKFGIGKVVQADAGMLYIIFRDKPGRVASRISRTFKALEVAPDQDDPVLRWLPQVVREGDSWVLPSPRITPPEAISRFLSRWPAGFDEPGYLGSERNYKWNAHILSLDLLGGAELERLLAVGDTTKLRERALKIMGGATSLPNRFGLIALSDALKAHDESIRLFETFRDLVAVDDAGIEGAFREYLAAFASLPQLGESKVFEWRNVTTLPFLADPQRFMFLKPKETKVAAEVLGFDLRYEARPNWDTYASLLEMARVWKEILSHQNPPARDMIDVQSFWFVTCGGYSDVDDQDDDDDA